MNGRCTMPSEVCVYYIVFLNEKAIAYVFAGLV